jgi:hypothetical protein
MFRIVIPFVCLAALVAPTTSRGASVAQNLSIEVTQSAQTGTCPQGTSYVPVGDGCQGAQANGSTYITNFFSGYLLGNPSYVTRPPWNVAGVDYPVGYSGTLRSAAVSGNLPSCASTSGANGTVKVSSTPCTLDHLDFTGMCVNITATSGTVTFTNDKFVWVSGGCDPSGTSIINTPSGSSTNVTLQYVEFRHSFSSNADGAVLLRGSGNLTASYSAFYYAPHHVLDSYGAAIYNLSYNYVEGAGGNGGHGNWAICESGNCTYNSQFETLFTGQQNGDAWDAPTVMTSEGGTVSGYYRYDTIINRSGSYANQLMNWEGGHTATVNLATIDISHNYLDKDGAGNYFLLSYNQYISFTGPFTCAGNIILNSNTTLTGDFGGGRGANNEWRCN